MQKGLTPIEILIIIVIIGLIGFLAIPVCFGGVPKPTKTIKATTYRIESDARHWTYEIDEIQIDGVSYLMVVEKGGALIPKVTLPAEKPLK